ncbi:hypothetical protein B0H63DRAFT_517316 [Podospora didyma]|uniref:Uncharacterized protein n=1 Tax=Podospora didyma TaxID=330526 RepID=A0AAE0P703_9PEZI|nr:hypothetical protein B0H63DRAFT_517316 [Podospora didyma]
MATSSSQLPPAPPHHQFLQGQQTFQYQQQYQQPQTQYPQQQPVHQQQQPQYLPQQQQQQQQKQQPQYRQAQAGQPRPAPQPTPGRKSRSFSFRSDKSHGSKEKDDLHETSAEKESKRLHSKADPTLAMNEAEPAEVAATVKSSLASLRSMPLKDCYGNPIADPDRSNPTRSRWERPLDTIRSFEAAIDGGYDKRRSIFRAGKDGPFAVPLPNYQTNGGGTIDSDSVAWGNNTNKRSSYYGGNGANSRFSHESYYNSRPPSMMYGKQPEGSQHDLRQMGQRDTYHEQQPGSGYGTPQNSGRRAYPRMSSEPQFAPPVQRNQPSNEYTLPSNHRSYETVASASGSGTSGEPAGYLTDPTSSDNSSVDRMQAVPKRLPEPMNDYGIGFGPNLAVQPPAFTVGIKGAGPNRPQSNAYPTNGTVNYATAPPQLPPKDRGLITRKPPPTEVNQLRPAQPEKRKSWFSRRFSKQG